MARRHAITLVEQGLRIPEDAFDFEGFKKWEESDEFPETGRIDYLEGDIHVDMSPEDLYTHGAPKTAIAMRIAPIVSDADLGEVCIDSTRVRSQFAALSVEPDIAVVLESSLEAGTVRLLPAAAQGSRALCRSGRCGPHRRNRQRQLGQKGSRAPSPSVCRSRCSRAVARGRPRREPTFRHP